MHRIDGPGATPDNKFTEGDPAAAVPATEVTDLWLNSVQEEIAAVIESAGITLDPANDAQLLAAITAKISAAIPANVPQGVRGAFSNLKLSASGTAAAIAITADDISLRSATAYRTVSSVALSVSLATAGVNGLDTGTSSASTWYSVWVIWNGTTTAGLLSLSATAPTMPAGYTHKARVGWIRTDATANKYPLSFVQQGRSVQYKIAAGSNVPTTPILSFGVTGSITTPTWVATAVGAFVPVTASAIKVAGNTTSAGLIVAPNNSFGAISSTTNPPPYLAFAGANNAQSSSPGLILLESTNIYLASSGSSAVITCFGWEDNL